MDEGEMGKVVQPKVIQMQSEVKWNHYENKPQINILLEARLSFLLP
jgi:hypothetical protein